VVWFGESLPSDVLGAADAYLNDVESIDIVMVIGTSARVWPAAGYIDEVLILRHIVIWVTRAHKLTGEGQGR
jgi:NAD-dependent SIR2 family protein deacetylase